MNTRIPLLAAISLPLFLPTLATADAACDPHVLHSPTQFPMRSQLRGQSGVVYLNVTVDENGRATRTVLERSSGHRLLDYAARESVQNEWRFDVSTCARKDLPATQVVSVEYRNEEYR